MKSSMIQPLDKKGLLGWSRFAVGTIYIFLLKYRKQQHYKTEKEVLNSLSRSLMWNILSACR